MRILHILGERGFSGGEAQLEPVIARLAAAGHESVFALQPGAGFERVAAANGCGVHTVRMRNSLDILAAASLRRLITRMDPDLVHLADSRGHKLGMLALVGRSAPPIVVTRRMDYPLRRALSTRRLYGERIAAIVAISEAVGAEIRAVGVPAARIHVIHDGVDPAPFADLGVRRAPVRAALDLDDDALVLLSAASLRPRKGQASLVEAFAALHADHPRTRLVLAGEGSDRAALEDLAKSHGVGEWVRFPGRLDMRDALAAADIACIPSLKEGLSVFSLEAQAAGVPVVASAVGGLLESVEDGVTGLHVPPGDSGALAKALGRLLADPAERTALGAAGRRRVAARFTQARMAKRTVALYESLVPGR